MNSLEELYVDELKDLYDAENQILKALPKMAKAASHPDLKGAFQEHEEQSRGHVERLEEIFEDLGQRPKGKKCVGMEGLIKEGEELVKEKPEPDVLNAGLIAKAQHVEHYEMAGYGTARAWAEKLGHARHVQLLQQTLEEEEETDRKLTELAESSINVEALEEGAPWKEEETRRSPARPTGATTSGGRSRTTSGRSGSKSVRSGSARSKSARSGSGRSGSARSSSGRSGNSRRSSSRSRSSRAGSSRSGSSGTSGSGRGR